MADVMPSPPPALRSPTSSDEGIEEPARKQQKRGSGAGHNGASASMGAPSTSGQSGPPYICPTCQTSYSRLEYLRRHERRHADIRPFVCDCGKGFSRSDVLSRHKRQCAVHLNGGAEEGDISAETSLKAATTGANKRSSASRAKKSSQRSRKSTGQEPDGSRQGNSRDLAQSPSSMIGGTSFPFQQPNMQMPSAPPPLLPPAPYGTDANNEFARSATLNNSFGNMTHPLSALNNFNAQQNYPSSPESNGTISQHSSPRFAARDMSRHGSNGSRFSLKKGGGSFDHIAPRGNSSATTSINPANHYPQEFWEALDPAAKTVTSSMVGNDFASASAHPAFSLPSDVTAAGALASVAANASAGNTAATANGVTTPRGEPQRFSVSTGPLSPFSSIALTSSMSPYLSAFSNARDTPFVASPNRSGIPGTPGSNLNIFDWTMRPPSKPASTSKRDSLSMQGNLSGTGTTKRKREEDEAGKSDEALLNADADERSAAALLDSLRNAGSRSQQSVAPTTLEATGSAVGAPTSVAEPPTSVAASSTPSMPTTSQSSEQPFFELRNATLGPEAFLLQLQGGAHEERTRTVGPNGCNVPLTNLDIIGQNAVDSGGFSLSQYGANAAANPDSWEAILFGPAATIGATLDGPPTTSSMGWLMSPGVQQIINTYSGLQAPSLPGENGSYFSGATTESQSATATKAPMQVTPLPHAASTLALEKAVSDVKNPFYIPPHLFRACYSVDHWKLPPLARLSILALHAQQNLLKHFPIIHEPTFRLDTTPGCLAFTMTMLGCHRHGRVWWTGKEVVTRGINGAVKVQVENGANEKLTADPIDEEDGEALVRPVVMTEKVEMLMRSFGSRAKSEKDKISVVQSLTLFQADQFLHSDASIRASAAHNHAALVALARRAAMFDTSAVHSGRKVSYTGEDVLRTTIFESGDLTFSYSFLPSYLPSCSDEEKVWRRWSELAGRRRTAYLLFVIDTVAYLDASAKLQLSLDEIAHLPLPTPDTVWRAPNVESWSTSLENYRGPTLDEALEEMLQGVRSPESDKASIYGRHGPFARLVMVHALLRGVIHLLEDRKSKVSHPSPLQAWMPNQKILDGTNDVEILKDALHRWREAWDQDALCLAASAPTARDRAAKNGIPDPDLTWLGGHFLFASKTASGATPLSDDALPFYWLAYVLLGHATLEEEKMKKEHPTDGLMQHLRMMAETYSETANADAKIKVEESLLQAKVPSPDYRCMLRFAKLFVQSGEHTE